MLKRYMKLIKDGEMMKEVISLRLLMSFGKHNTHVRLSECKNEHSFDIIFIDPKKEQGIIRVYGDEVVMLNGKKIKENAILNEGDMISVGKINLLYYVNEIKENWKDVWEERKKKRIRRGPVIKRYKVDHKKVQEMWEMWKEEE